MKLSQNDDFNQYVENFKLLNMDDKKKEIILLIKENLSFLYEIISRYKGDVELLYNREILDVNKDSYSDDDFMEAMLVYINSIRELLANYVELKEEL